MTERGDENSFAGVLDTILITGLFQRRGGEKILTRIAQIIANSETGK
jgi:hypothetical protein